MTSEIKRGDNSTIDQALAAIAINIQEASGSVFYSGRSAFSKRSDLYILGLNPGGNPVDQVSETVAADIDQFWTQPASWSAYADESWQGAAPGTWGMQPRILHMLARLKLSPREVPASNLVFVRTSSEAALRQQKAQLIRDCWPVHQAVIDSLNVRVLLCFGGTAGRWVRERLTASQLIDSYRETNNRGWASECHQAVDGRKVVTVSHPGRADWRNPLADPSELVARALAL